MDKGVVMEGFEVQKKPLWWNCGLKKLLLMKTSLVAVVVVVVVTISAPMFVFEVMKEQVIAISELACVHCVGYIYSKQCLK